MARPRNLNPSPVALKRRAERAKSSGKRPAKTKAPAPQPERPEHDDAPEISSAAPTEEAVRLRAIYDARKSRLSSLAEGLRLEQERGKLWTSAQVRARDDAWNGAAEDRLDLVERLLDTVDGVTTEQRKTFLAAARAWRLETKRLLASLHA